MSWQNYKGVLVPQSDVDLPGDAGQNLKADLMTLADRALSNSAIVGNVLFVGLDEYNHICIKEDDGLFCWDITNHRLGVGTSEPLEQVQINGNGKALLMATGSEEGTSETHILFGAGIDTTTQYQRLRYRYGNSNLYFERKANDGTWSHLMMLDRVNTWVEVAGTGLLMATDPEDSAGTTQIMFGRTGGNAQFMRLNYVFNTSDLRFQRWQSGGTWTTIMTVDWSDSRVGIGTESPTTMLDVNGPVTLGPYSGSVETPPDHRAVLYIDDSGSAPILKIKFDNGQIRDVAVG